MKFTKEEFSEKLKERLTNKGKKPMQQSERTFKKLVEKIYARLEKRDDDETELDDAVADYLEDFEEIEGNLNKDEADFVKEWKKNHPQPDPDDDYNDDGNDSKLDKLLKEIEDLKKAQSKRDTEERIAKIRKDLKASLKKEGVDDDEWLNGYIKKIVITEDTDIEEEKKDALNLFNKTNSVVNHNTPGATGNKNTDSGWDYLK